MLRAPLLVALAGLGLLFGTLATSTGCYQGVQPWPSVDEVKAVRVLEQPDPRTLEIYGREYGPEHSVTAEVLIHLADVEVDRRNFDRSFALQTDAIDHLRLARGPGHPSVAKAHYTLGSALLMGAPGLARRSIANLLLPAEGRRSSNGPYLNVFL